MIGADGADNLMRNVTLEVQDRVAVITLGRPRVNERMAADLAEACASAERDDGVRVVVLAGAGGVFCAGTEPAAPADAGALDRLRAAGFAAAITKPVIAAMDGESREPAVRCGVRACRSQHRYAESVRRRVWQ